MTMRDTLHQSLQQRVYGSVTSDLLFKRARGSKYLVQCLQRNGTLTGHDGCVNTICWNDTGDLLLSGSDDCRLNIYRPFQKKLLQSIHTGHRANIFCAKFLPCTSDKSIVSCAGDGMIHLTDLERPDTNGKCSFNCHSGTAYEMITRPGDPNTFISCGEDGTVRMFDLRTKSNCVSRDCKEDILIECGRAVTSIGINPLAPYQLGVGCEDSTVALFDCRSLSTAGPSCSTNGMRGMVCKFKPDSLKDRTCRVTSLQYSSDGGQLLVSYCADYVYLFNTKGEREFRPSGEDGNGLFDNNGQRRNLPLKRLRLRGDWSDTGPNARPESEAVSTESSLMQRMSDLFVRWIEESFRGNQRRLRTSSSDNSPSTSGATPSLPAHSIGSTSPDSLGATPSLPARSIGSTTPDSSGATPSLPARSIGSSTLDSSGATPSLPPHSIGSSTPDRSGATPSLPACSTSFSTSDSSGATPSLPARSTSSSTSDSSGTLEPSNLSQLEANISTVDESETLPQFRSDVDVRENYESTTIDVSTDRGSEFIGDEPMDSSSAQDEDTACAMASNDESIQTNVECSMESHHTAGENDCEQMEIQTDRGVSIASSLQLPGIEPSRGQGGAQSRGEVSPSPDTLLPGLDIPYYTHSLAAIRIQRMFRRHRSAKYAKNDEECTRTGQGGDQEIWIPKMTKVYRGHRNARTMIKEAKFWGDRYIISGSDCGRIFIWDKNTTEIITILQGDRHVVNCVQPHPFDPVLASSGIDYDIKLWAPTANQPCEIDGLEEIIKRNEQMLEESRDTITVPASFMLRMLASLNHTRFARNQTDDSDSDDNI